MSTLPPLVVVVPTKNRRALLERALQSVWSQSYESYRIVIVNDGSTDGTREYLDSLTDSRIQIIHNEKSRGVNAARNAAFKTLKEGEWAVQLDDDDTLLPNALATIGTAIAELPSTTQILCFNTHIKTLHEEYTGGRDFLAGEKYYEPTYLAIMTDDGLRTRGDNRAVWKWTLFPMYLFAEDINGFEGEWWLLVARDNVGIRFVPQQTTEIDLVHEGEHLSNVASRRDPAAFMRAQLRIFNAHAKFFSEYPAYAKARAIVGLKLALRAGDAVNVIRFCGYYLRAVFTRSSQVPT